MTATILVVDDLEQNVKLLEAKLLSEYYTVLTANSGTSAIEILDTQSVDIILLDVMMPGMDGFETCKRIKANINTKHIPIVMVTALTDLEDRVKGLQAGADEFLTKPISDTALFARVKSLARTKNIIDELHLRNKINREFGESLPDIEDDFSKSKIILLDDDIVQAKNIKTYLQPITQFITLASIPEEIFNSSEAACDLIIISCQIEQDALRVGVSLRSHPKFRNVVLMFLAQEEDMPIVIRSMDLGINDYFMYPVDKSELQARVRTQLRRKLYQDYLRKELEEKVNLSTKDGLTGVFNRRYFDIHIKQMSEKAKISNQKISLLILDMDFFKLVNDNYGHQSGDKVLQSLCEILKQSVRVTDLIARYGGEEFAVLFSNMELDSAVEKAESIRKAVADFEFEIPGQAQAIKKTISIGVAEFSPQEEVESFISRTDKALYRAKESGRNRVEKALEPNL